MNKLGQYLGVMGLFNIYNDIDLMPKEKQYKGVLGDVRNSKTNPKINRNSLCICDSGKKYKKCCMMS